MMGGETILIALALVFVFEGFLYAFFPDAMKKMMAMALHMPSEQLRMTGLIIASIGILCVWLLRLYA